MLVNYILVIVVLILLVYVIIEIKSLYNYIKDDLVDEIASTIEVLKDDNYINK